MSRHTERPLPRYWELDDYKKSQVNRLQIATEDLLTTLDRLNVVDFLNFDSVDTCKACIAYVFGVQDEPPC